MFRNRSFLLKMVNDKDLKDKDPILNVEGLPGKEPVDYAKIVDSVGKNVIGGLMLYITADTLRKVVIYTVSAKV